MVRVVPRGGGLVTQVTLPMLIDYTRARTLIGVYGASVTCVTPPAGAVQAAAAPSGTSGTTHTRRCGTRLPPRHSTTASRGAA
jgi:hypothetical protein